MVDESLLRSNGSLNEFRRPGHSYRNFIPADLFDLASATDRDTALEGLSFIESGRFRPMIETADELLAGIDEEYRPDWIARNPDLTEYVLVYRYLTGEGVDAEVSAYASSHLTDDRYSAVDVPTYPPGVPGFKYQQTNPHDLMDDHDDISDKGALREQLSRIERPLDVFLEPGRLKQFLEPAHKHFTRLDLDERRSFARRNPGATEYMSVYGWSEDLVYQESLTPNYPALPRREDVGETYTPPRD